MGGGMYSADARCSSGRTKYYATASASEIFKEKKVNNAMNPNGVKLRESRDSNEHPNSLAIILALDVTGSMGSIPVHLIKKGLPNVMEGIIKGGIKDPQMLFLGIGDHECDDAPLQVGQFESSDALLDHWLQTIYLEGGGGGNDGESYLLAWYFAGYHTSIDCWEKRKQKGFLFTVGDEPVLRRIPKSSLKEIMGTGQPDDMEASALLEKARESYHVYHILVKQGSNGSKDYVHDGWKQIMGKENLLIAENHEDIPQIIADTINKNVTVPTASGVDVPTSENCL